MLRIDDIPQQVADDIHAFGVIWMRKCERSKLWQKNLLLEYSEELATNKQIVKANVNY